MRQVISRAFAGRSAPSHDPAPSRIAYRMHRLWLRPWVRFAVRAGMPALLVGAVSYGIFSQEHVRDGLRAQIAEVRRSIEDRPEFAVNLMAIDGGSAEVAEDIREVLAMDFPVSSFDLDLDTLRTRVEELDAVARASIRIRSGGVLQIDLSERVPAIVWRGPHGLELLDAEGHRVATLISRNARSDLPLIAGDGGERAVPEALDLLAVARPLEARVRGLVRVGERRWDVVLDRDQRLLLPEDGAVAALERIIALDQVRGLLGRAVSVVDMRNPQRPTLRAEGAARDYLQYIRDLRTGVRSE